MADTAHPEPMKRPVLTLPEAESVEVRAAYEAASVILEYGSGGSTVMAGDMPGKTVFTVESDANWLAMMQGWFDANPPQSAVALHHGDIGPTGPWGHPRNDREAVKWPGYALSVWQRPDFLQPDVVLVDGRFRVACVLATAFQTRAPVTVLLDDYVGRTGYYVLEKLFTPTRLIGRMARFDLVPGALAPEHFGWVVRSFLEPG